MKPFKQYLKEEKPDLDPKKHRFWVVDWDTMQYYWNPETEVLDIIDALIQGDLDPDGARELLQIWQKVNNPAPTAPPVVEPPDEEDKEEDVIDVPDDDEPLITWEDIIKFIKDSPGDMDYWTDLWGQVPLSWTEKDTPPPPPDK